MAPNCAPYIHLLSLSSLSKPFDEAVSELYSTGNAPTVPNSETSRLSGWLKIAATPSKLRSLEYNRSVDRNGLAIRPPVRLRRSLGFQVR